ncbi:MAG: RES family NAD+ phosphorylase [Niveispirillum sp.]|nr:RES family NAD+ phosphorylase [Niveispirillum sp.]
MGWRICRAPFADLSGEGARLYGGRWNQSGLPLVYLAETAALAVLEVRVHLDLPPDLLPDDYVLSTVTLAGLTVEHVGDLPSDTAAFGTHWLRSARTPVLSVPSLIVPESRNLLLNPAHPEANGARITGSRAFSFDRRLWAPSTS